MYPPPPWKWIILRKSILPWKPNMDPSLRALRHEKDNSSGRKPEVFSLRTHISIWTKYSRVRPRTTNITITASLSFTTINQALMTWCPSCVRKGQENKNHFAYTLLHIFTNILHWSSDVFYIHINHINLLNIKANIALPKKIFVFNTVQRSFMDILKMIICALNTLAYVPAFKSNSKVKVESKL